MTLHYRVLVHPGDVEQGGVAEAFKKYTALKKNATQVERWPGVLLAS